MFPILHTGFQLQVLEIDTKLEKLLYVEQYTMETKLERDTLHIYSKLKTFQLIYNHTDVFTWTQKNFSNIETEKSKNMILSSGKQMQLLKNRESVLERFLRCIIVKGCAELWNVSTFFKLEDQNASFCCSHTKFLLEQYNERRSNVYENKITNLFLSNRHWSTELMIESLWWTLGGPGRDTNTLKKFHTRGSPIFLGVSLIKLSSYGNATKLDLSIHTLRTEYSNQFASFVLQARACMQQYKNLTNSSKNEIGTKLSTNRGTNFNNILVNAKITDIGFYFFNKFDYCLLASLGEISLGRTQPISVFKIDTFQIAILPPTKSSHMNLTNFTDIFVNIKMIRVELLNSLKVTDNPQITIYILDDNEAMWNPNLHMHITYLLREIIELKNQIKPKIENDLPIELQINTKEQTKLFFFDLYAEGNTVFGIKISDRHSMQIFFENVYLNKKDKTLISIENLFINIDGQHIFTFNNLDIHSVSELARITTEREQLKYNLPSNKVWVTVIGGAKIIFPYIHDFTDAIKNELLSLWKWLKLVHKYKKKEFTIDSKLPADLLIQVIIIHN